ncbi:choline dehydrogenase-like flavoprotein [Rhodoferax ferrireducens]|uniref:Choline dehydrogenase-like flavoprotein n=1 Tax=Rhodoferax ferrireducens TaxID=192843 RepID=A0ABU2C6C5_9BURK|nr:GMC family oxidoreductase [Rhodoferax ferrireducens]MDR7376898.1 choline dehydrogenase-like flavoprotein [Rhodoferax ferrireducens]
MIDSANNISSKVDLVVDICIVGAGAAGISIALELSGKGFQVLLLEAGTSQEDPATQALYAGEVADEKMHSPTDKYRHRRFGGSTAIWGGRCMPFDPIDLEPRSYVPFSGWPIGYSDIAPFFPKANNYLEAGRYEYDADTAFNPLAAPMVRGFNSERVRTNGLERFSCPTNMAARYQGRLQAASDVRVLLEANCTGIRLNSEGNAVDHLDVATLAGKQFKVRAKDVVLAIGGLETARLLLASNDVHPQGVGNANDVVGRYYMCHIAGNVGSLVVKGGVDNVRHGYEISPDGVYCRRRLQLTEDTQRQLGVGNMVARLHFPKITDPAHRSGVLSGLFLARNFISYEYGKRLKDGEGDSVGRYMRHLWNVISGPIDTLAFLTHWVAKRTLAVRKFPSVILRNKSNRFSLEVHAEQIPRPDSRVSLLPSKDALGMPQIKVDWRYSKEDIDTVRKTLRTFSEEFARSGVATFDFDEKSLEKDLLRFGAYGGHHVGTARMGADPKTSVVDKNCAVHGLPNLHIASSAVFPTSSQANPTLMIVAMALRLASHIQAKDCQARQEYGVAV